jgi:hypothetical protein
VLSAGEENDRRIQWRRHRSSINEDGANGVMPVHSCRWRHLPPHLEPILQPRCDGPPEIFHLPENPAGLRRTAEGAFIARLGEV